MIDMRMAENDGIDRIWIELKGCLISAMSVCATLNESAIKQDALPGVLDHMTGTCNLLRSTPYGYFH